MATQILNLKDGAPNVGEIRASETNSANDLCGCFCYVSDPLDPDVHLDNFANWLFS